MCLFIVKNLFQNLERIIQCQPICFIDSEDTNTCGTDYISTYIEILYTHTGIEKWVQTKQ